MMMQAVIRVPETSARQSSMRRVRAGARWIMAAALLAGACNAQATSDVVISQVYGGGGNTSAPYQNDFVELFNRSSAAVSISGWSVQYASASGSGTFGSNGPVALSGTLQPGQHYLVRFGTNNASVGGALPAPDGATSSLNISATNGKVALVNSPAGLACNGGSSACTADQLSHIVDYVAYGTADFLREGPAVTGMSNTLAALRLNAGCVDTDVNNADFTTGAPTPRNTASALTPCGTTGNAPVIPDCPANFAVTLGTPASTNLSASDADGTVVSAAITSTPVAGITLGNIVAGSTLNAQLQVAGTVPTGNYPTTVTFSNADSSPQTATCTVSVNVAPPANGARIHDIQGAAHISPLNGQSVSNVPGIVTAVRGNGFNLQDPNADANPATSEAIFVYTGSVVPAVSTGDSVQVSGTVQEFRAGGSDGLTNLTITEIVNPTVTVLSNGNTLPEAILLGAGGLAIPTGVIEDDATGDVETGGTFDPATDAIDFYESLEHMRVRFNNAVAVGPTNSHGEIPVLVDNGVGSTLRSARGGVLINATDSNPERLFLDDMLMSTPAVNVGDGFASVTAVVDYSFDNFKFDITSSVTRIDNGLTAESTSLTGSAAHLTVGSFNVENLAATNAASKFAALAGQVVNSLHSPDILALMEIQDNNGTTDNGVVDATTTFDTFIAAIQSAGGPVYQFRNIDPVNGADGGAPGGNIRVGFLFNPARVSFVDRPGGGSTVATTVVSSSSGPQLSSSPGRVDPANSAWNASRKPLAGEFLFNGRKVFVIANHFVSKLADDPLFGHLQPPVRSSEVQRNAQAAAVNGFVRSILAIDANASVVVLGDLNDFEFSDTMTVLKGSNALVDMISTLPANERYTYVFDGNSQALDHILVSPALAGFAQPQLDVVHVNAEFASQVSDHDPDVVRLQLPKAGDVDGDGDVDKADVDAIVAARNTNAAGPYDPRNMNGDARIDTLDARLATAACTRSGCAVQ